MSTKRWKDEQSASDAFVEAVHGGKRITARRAGKCLVQHYFESGDWHNWVDVDSGTLLRPDDIPLTPDDCIDGTVGVEALEEFVTPERMHELQDGMLEGEILTPQELQIWQKLAAEAILTENPDCDAYNLWGIWRVTHSDGRVAFLAHLGGGYSFTEPSMRYICGTTTAEDALAQLQSLGFTDVEDVRARWPDGAGTASSR